MNYQTICFLLLNCKKSVRVPSVKKLLEMLEEEEISIIFRSTSDIKDGITIFSNGYVVYGNGERMTVFAMITYWFKKGVLDLMTKLPTDEHIFDPENERTDIYGIPKWVYDLTVFGERRLLQSGASRVGQREYPTDVIEEYAESRYRGGELPMDIDAENRMYVSDLLTCLNKKQLHVVRLYFWNGYTCEQIAEILNAIYKSEGKNKHASRQSVSQMLDRALKKMRKKIEENKIPE